MLPIPTYITGYQHQQVILGRGVWPQVAHKRGQERKERERGKRCKVCISVGILVGRDGIDHIILLKQ